jgi:hypothetical protein
MGTGVRKSRRQANRESRKRRLLLLVASVVGVAGLAGGAYLYRQHQLDGRAIAARERGLAAIEAGDYAAALDGIGRYLKRFGGDGATAQDHVLYARARRHVELPNRRHLLDARGSLLKALAMEPGREDARAELLELHLATAATTEAIGLIDEMLATTPDDLDLLAAKRDVLEATRTLPEALAVARRMNVLAPDSLPDWFRTAHLMVAGGAPAREVDAWVDGVIASHAGDARYQLLRSALCKMRRDEVGAKDVLEQVLSRTAEPLRPRFSRSAPGVCSTAADSTI